jgi:cell division protein FtsB
MAELREDYEAMRLEWSKAIDERDEMLAQRDDYKDRWEVLGRVAKKQLDDLAAENKRLRAEVAHLRAENRYLFTGEDPSVEQDALSDG